MGFEAYLQGETLGLYLFELDVNNNPIIGSATEIIMLKQGAATSPAIPGTAPSTQASPPASNPLTAADPLVGTFSDGNLVLRLQGGQGAYTGDIHFSGQTFPATAQGHAAELRGTFTSGGQAFSFTARLEGDTLNFETGGASYRLDKQRTATPATPTPETRTAADPVIVEGPYASLTRDNALAFIEAFEFALEQVGYAYSFTPAEREQLLQAVTQAFPTADQSDQLVLSQAREIWNRVQVNWASAPEHEKREFLLGVFILAFGEEAVQQWVGPSGSGGQGQSLGSSNCGSFEDCTSRFVDERTWTDTFNAQGCWAAAGCDSYDSSSGTFSYTDDY